MIKRLISYLTLLLSCFTVQAEMRIIVDEDFTWVNQADCDEMLYRIKDAGFNTLIAYVWSGRGTSWVSNLAPLDGKIEHEFIQGSAPLAYLTRKAHERDIKVIVSFAVMKRQDDYDILPQFYEDETPAIKYQKAYELHMPEFRQFIVDLMVEVHNNYDIDGINLDYIRSMGDCTSNTCVESYFNETGRNLIDDHTIKGYDTEAFNLISEWNKEAVTEIVEQLRDRTTKRITTTSIIGGWETQGADSIGWLNNNLVNHVFHMYYGYPKNFDFKYFFNKLNLINAKRKLTIMVSNYDGNTPRSGQDIDTLMDFSLYVPGNKNTALYLYRYLTNEQIEAIR